MNKYGFKGNAPDSIQVIQLITFLYVGVAKLNDGRLSNNELHKMVQKHENYGVKNKDSTKFIDEAVSWWNDSLKKDVHLDDLFQCAKLLIHQEGWSNKLFHASWIHLHWASSPFLLNCWGNIIKKHAIINQETDL